MGKRNLKFAAVTLVLVLLAGFLALQPYKKKERTRDITEVPETSTYHYTQQQSMFFRERLNFGKKVGFALLTMAKENSGRLPSDLRSAEAWLETNEVPIAGYSGPVFGVGVSNFALVYKGNLSLLKKPEHVILAREKDAVEVHEGRWTRMYIFADGSVNRLEATTPDGFSAREKEVWPGQPQ